LTRTTAAATRYAATEAAPTLRFAAPTTLAAARALAAFHVHMDAAKMPAANTIVYLTAAARAAIRKSATRMYARWTKITTQTRPR
tara:strand:+ start:282 stop:536 length:255 start_codon:yes stop_codon:yes gene_type:complete